MALGQVSKIFIFIIVINSLVTYAANFGMIGEDVEVQRMQDYINDLQSKSDDTITDTNTGSGITILEYFNPLNYEVVANALGLITGFFIDPILMFGVLPSPFSYMMGLLFSILEITAVAGFIRGVAA
ncbi:MAG: hypothetical protein ABEK36_04535 [Candidatus Aenigmatarchaeota archaeon]